MAFDKAFEHLKKYKLEDRVQVFEDSSATVKEAAERLNCEEALIAKTMGFLVGDKTTLILAAGDAKIDNAKYKGEFKTKAKMIPYDQVLELVGHEPGGVCPFGINDGIEVYLDDSLKRFEIVYPACGSANSAVKLNISELEKSSNYLKWIDVCKY